MKLSEMLMSVAFQKSHDGILNRQRTGGKLFRLRHLQAVIKVKETITISSVRQ